MNITVKPITDISLMKECLEFAYGIEESKMDESLAYLREHSIIRTQLFLVKMEAIPTKVSVHLVRHAAVGQFHLVGSNRYDWQDKGTLVQLTEEEHDESVNRNTPVNHVMLLNAQHLIEMARKRLCSKAHRETQQVVHKIKDALLEVDPALSKMMVPNCFYRGGICPEADSCGLSMEYIKQLVCQIPEHIYRDARNEAKGVIIQ